MSDVSDAIDPPTALAGHGADHGGHGHASQGSIVALAVGALGVVFGDLGTSPLYAIRETFESHHHRLAVDEVNVLGAISIALWTLVVIIAVKYVLLVMRADNHGEGGILALTALVSPAGSTDRRAPVARTGALVLLGLFGTALLFGDGMITPAISVLSAVEGVKVVQPDLESWVLPAAIAIIVGLFAIQRFGTGLVGKVFGPVMVLWFGTMAVLGTASMLRNPEILQAFNPVHGVRYFTTNTTKGFLSMGSLFLVVTGGEALYADMGHFGRRPIKVSWFSMVLPSLVLVYLGIGALLLRDPHAIESPFFLLAPEGLRIPLVVLATLATVIASQALISGVFSITVQAVQLGYAPRVRIVNTSSKAQGQIYVPGINWLLMVACIGLIVGFGSSARLAAAFGLSVTGTMFITTILFAVYAERHFGWNRVLVWTAAGLILVVEGAFLAANLFKIPDGGWFPLVVGVVVLTVLTTWKTGRRLVHERLRSGTPLETFVAGLARGRSKSVVRVDGTAVFLYSDPGSTPPALLAHVRSSGALHRDVYVVAVETASSPMVPASQRESVTDVGGGVRQVTLRYGFMEEVQVATDLESHLRIEPARTDYFLGRETIRSTDRPGMARWREHLFAVLARNASDVAAHYHLPDDRVVEIGQRLEL
ncbi:potassium transporter Kup [Aquihabitans sp. G128]|uniref:potassium transporter Kup n=1 Tax=Aquihabitans sp. G128 TaxID=2849779 RepID=UPI001C24E128|nr:potassium transporter Kup [Aquihabitans sp. G128]QXC59897.1 potassium transporter Kup [Aquihabitans sp. G128]